MKNSWYLKKNGVHHYFCKCGEHNSLAETEKEKSSEFDVIEFNREEIEESNVFDLYYYPDNNCNSCNNENYLDVNALFFDDRTRYWRDVKWNYKEVVTDNLWKVVAFVKIPKLDRKKGIVDFEELELSSYMVSKGGISHYEEQRGYFFKKSIIIDGNYHRIDRILKEEMSQRILALLQHRPMQTLSWIKQKVESLNDLLFFLKNPKLRSLDMVKWENKEYFIEIMNQEVSLENCLTYFRNHRSEKSIVKVQLSSYMEMMNRYDGYNPMVDYIFSRSISDVNHLHRVLNMSIEKKYRLFNGSNIENINYFIDFLKNHYHEKHIVQLWLNISKDDLSHYLVRDSINLFGNREVRAEINANFRKTALNIRAVHHELTRHSRRLGKVRLKEMTFSYEDFLIESEVTYEGITYRLPEDSKKLYYWGELLANCISSYSNFVMMGKSVIFGLFVGNRLTYAVELRNHKVVQASASFNRSIEKSEREKIDRWHQEVYMKNFIKVFR